MTELISGVISFILITVLLVDWNYLFGYVSLVIPSFVNIYLVSGITICFILFVIARRKV